MGKKKTLFLHLFEYSIYSIYYGIFKINDKDPFYEPWVKALEEIIPNLKLEKKHYIIVQKALRSLINIGMINFDFL